MIKYSIISIEAKDYYDLLEWCRENLHGFSQHMPVGIPMGGKFFAAELHFPDEDALVHFKLARDGEFDICLV